MNVYRIHVILLERKSVSILTTNSFASAAQDILEFFAKVKFIQDALSLKIL